MSQEVTPRFIRMGQAPAYLGMSRAIFNQEVRPHVREVRIGKQGIAFDRNDLDRWADAYLAAHAGPKTDATAAK